MSMGVCDHASKNMGSVNFKTSMVHSYSGWTSYRLKMLVLRDSLNCSPNRANTRMGRFSGYDQLFTWLLVNACREPDYKETCTWRKTSKRPLWEREIRKFFNSSCSCSCFLFPLAHLPESPMDFDIPSIEGLCGFHRRRAESYVSG